jgi:hypothetical protein
VADSNGGYIFKALPPGAYKVSCELTGFSTVENSVTLTLGASVPLDASLAVASVQETVTVTVEETQVLTSVVRQGAATTN